MCLTTVEQVFVEPTDTDWKVGYKVFCEIGYERVCSPFYQECKYEYGHTYTDDNEDIILAEDGGSYMSGYHLFTNYEDARYSLHLDVHLVVKVKYKDVVAVGRDYAGRIVVVARTMKVVKPA